MSQIQLIVAPGGSGGSGIQTINGDVGSVTGTTVTLTGGTTGLITTGVGTTMTLSGTLSKALFQAYLSGNQTNVTGDGTNYTIQFNSTSYNVASCFNTGTYTFTAPTTGKYIFTGTCYGFGYGSGHTQQNINLILTSGTYFAYTVNPFAMSGNGTLILPWSVTAQMTAGDTATVSFFVNNSTKTIGLGGLQGLTTFAGSLIST